MRTFNWKNILFQNASAKNRVKIRAQISWKILYHKILKIVEDNFENFVFLFFGFHTFLTFLTFHTFHTFHTFLTFLKYSTLGNLTLAFLTFHTFLKYLTLGFLHIFSWWGFLHILCQSPHFLYYLLVHFSNQHRLHRLY